MDLIDRLNASIKYIEGNLYKDISYDEVAKIAYCSSYHYQRMFSYILDMTLSEYIRRRRLTLAALELQQSNIKVIDVALKYGYNSPTSFTRAFVKVHGVTPSEAKSNGTNLKLYPPISFNISIKGGVFMNYRIEEKEGLRLIGIKENVTTIDGYNFKRIPEMWNEIMKDGIFEKIEELCIEDNQCLMGACANFDKDNFDYYIVVPSDKNIPENMCELNIEKGTWVIFQCNGILDLQSTFKRIYTDWFPTSGYEHAGKPEIEYYPQGSIAKDSGQCEIWIPIIKK